MTAIRRPMLKIVEGAQTARPEPDSRRVQHDARGNAVWAAPISLEDTGDLVLEMDQPAESAPAERDPYNSGPPAGAARKSR